MSATREFEETGAWLRRFHSAPDAGTRLICFPHAGGSATFYFPVSRAVPPAVEVLAIQYPGRQDRRHEALIDDIRTLADMVVEQLLPWADRPLALFGHSMGATLAFEVALRLEDAGITPVYLFASGRRAPSRYRLEQVHLLDDDALIADMKRLSGTGSQILDDDELIRMVLPYVRNDYKAAETYHYQEGSGLSCPVLALTGDRDPRVSVEDARAWGEHTCGPFDLRVFNGGHFFINDHAPAITKEIIECLNS
ncbi:alpha/beta fold hydrolase [Streptomyces sp. NPDC048484]|uniref:thioesterase II family protein n=1 Tax=Streptomyces sp. NPDC048484 TaxID=3155146 RepID=UPI00341345AC